MESAELKRLRQEQSGGPIEKVVEGDRGIIDTPCDTISPPEGTEPLGRASLGAMETVATMSNNGPTFSAEAVEPVKSDNGFVVAKFDDLYRTEYVPMVKLARGLVDSSERAEEIVQDAFAKVFERWNRLRAPGGYLRVSVINGARSELRKREVSRRLGLARRAEDDAAERDYLIDALDQLPAKQKTVLVLRFYADMSEKEIADTLGIRPGTVKSTTSRGLARLRKALEQ